MSNVKIELPIFNAKAIKNIAGTNLFPRAFPMELGVFVSSASVWESFTPLHATGSCKIFVGGGTSINGAWFVVVGRWDLNGDLSGYASPLLQVSTQPLTLFLPNHIF